MAPVLVEEDDVFWLSLDPPLELSFELLSFPPSLELPDPLVVAVGFKWGPVQLVVGNADIPLVPPSAVTCFEVCVAVVTMELVTDADVLLLLDASVVGVEAVDGAASEELAVDEALLELVLHPIPRKQKSADARAAKSAMTRY